MDLSWSDIACLRPCQWEQPIRDQHPSHHHESNPYDDGNIGDDDGGGGGGGDDTKRYLKVVKPGQWSRNSLVNVPSIIVAPLLLLVLSLMTMHWNHPSYCVKEYTPILQCLFNVFCVA